MVFTFHKKCQNVYHTLIEFKKSILCCNMRKLAVIIFYFIYISYIIYIVLFVFQKTKYVCTCSCALGYVGVCGDTLMCHV